MCAGRPFVWVRLPLLALAHLLGLLDLDVDTLRDQGDLAVPAPAQWQQDMACQMTIGFNNTELFTRRTPGTQGV